MAPNRTVYWYNIQMCLLLIPGRSPPCSCCSFLGGLYNSLLLLFMLGRTHPYLWSFMGGTPIFSRCSFQGGLFSFYIAHSWTHSSLIMFFHEQSLCMLFITERRRFCVYCSFICQWLYSNKLFYLYSNIVIAPY